MSELYQRVLLWHKLTAQTTGGLALCSVKFKLNREDTLRWIETYRNVADEMESVLAGGGFILDEKGRRLVGSTGGKKPTSRFFTKDGDADVEPFLESVSKSPLAASPPKAGGLRIAKRKTAK